MRPLVLLLEEYASSGREECASSGREECASSGREECASSGRMCVLLCFLWKNMRPLEGKNVRPLEGKNVLPLEGKNVLPLEECASSCASFRRMCVLWKGRMFFLLKNVLLL